MNKQMNEINPDGSFKKYGEVKYVKSHKATKEAENRKSQHQSVNSKPSDMNFKGPFLQKARNNGQSE